MLFYLRGILTILVVFLNYKVEYNLSIDFFAMHDERTHTSLYYCKSGNLCVWEIYTSYTVSLKLPKNTHGHIVKKLKL